MPKVIESLSEESGSQIQEDRTHPGPPPTWAEPSDMFAKAAFPWGTRSPQRGESCTDGVQAEDEPRRAAGKLG